jgi:hypothetical protein
MDCSLYPRRLSEKSSVHLIGSELLRGSWQAII